LDTNTIYSAHRDFAVLGFPQDCEKYLASDNHVIVNVPPTFMFKALIFKPPRLAAIFRKMGAADPVDEPEKST
jgi:hypothetical protein